MRGRSLELPEQAHASRARLKGAKTREATPLYLLAFLACSLNLKLTAGALEHTE